MIVFSFCLFLVLFVLIGAYSAKVAQKTSGDYLLAGSSVKPWLVALSAVATNNSGYMFIGQIGFTYAVGLHSIWVAIGWVLGDFFTSFFVHRKLRDQVDKSDALSFSGLIASWYNRNYQIVRILGAVITIAFLGTYAAAQLNAGSKALHVLLDWDYSLGAIVGAAMVVIYCFAGGIRASIWTDAAQSFVMITAMSVMLFVGLQEIGGLDAFMTGLQNVSDDYMSVLPPDQGYGLWGSFFLFTLGWVLAGAGVIGQPQIMVRFMTMDHSKHMNRVRLYYYMWFLVFFVMTILVALCARLLLPDVASFDAELALPTLAVQLLPEVFVGLVLAGLFAATMSTADSQILSCTAALSSDIAPKKLGGYIANKCTTVGVLLFALAIALSGPDSVFVLVLVSWSLLGAAFGPVLFLYALNQKISQPVVVAMMIGGAATVSVWHYLGLNNIIFEIAPGILCGFVIYGIGRLFSR